MRLNNSSLHYIVMKHIVDRGNAPSVRDLARVFNVTSVEVVTALKRLQDYHGVVLHPSSSEIWVMHPFSTAPTNFWLESENGAWWGNCAWCSLGAAALINRDLTITTTLGAESEQTVVEIVGGQIVTKDLYVHFPIPMGKAWENVTYTCSTMLMFDSEPAIDSWCERHAVEKGDVQPIDKIWEFSKRWYGKHLDPNWVKWSTNEARDIFERFELTGPIWELPSSDERF